MAQPVTTQHQIAPAGPASRTGPSWFAVSGAGLGAASLLAALALWFHYGAAVFFEMMASGIAGCF
jgi:hypothetical protein